MPILVSNFPKTVIIDVSCINTLILQNLSSTALTFPTLIEQNRYWLLCIIT
jgi:hypothetical protein